MNDFKKMIVDNTAFKIALAIISVISIIGILFNLRGIAFLLFLYAPMGVIYCDMYTKNKIKATSNTKIIFNNIVFVVAFPGYLLFKLAVIILKGIWHIAGLTTGRKIKRR